MTPHKIQLLLSAMAFGSVLVGAIAKCLRMHNCADMLLNVWLCTGLTAGILALGLLIFGGK